MKALKRIEILTKGWLAVRVLCLARRWGIVGIAAANVIDGPYKGLPLGVAMGLEKLDG